MKIVATLEQDARSHVVEVQKDGRDFLLCQEKDKVLLSYAQAVQLRDALTRLIP